MKKPRSNHYWLKDHAEDEFVKQARVDGYRSRASYKLLEINAKYGLLRPGYSVVDLGAAPGGWSELAVKIVGTGRVTALDRLAIEPILGVKIILGDFTESEPLQTLLTWLGESPVDLVISDMAPKLSGIKHIDQPKSIYLVELALDLCGKVLKKRGNLVCKCFEGVGIHYIRASFRSQFNKVINFKPKASRSKSREIYLIGQDFIG